MAKPEKNNNKENKHFFKDFKAELKKVNWPNSKQIINNTTAVLTIVIITAVIVFVLDFVFELLNTQGIDRLRNLVETTQNVENTDSNEVVENESNAEEENNTTGEENATEENTVEESPVNEETNQVETVEE